MRHSLYEWESTPSSGGAPGLEEDTDNSSEKDYGLHRDPRYGGGEK